MRAILHIKGHLTSLAAKTVFEAYESIVLKKGMKIVIDFAQTQYINSSGVSVLVQLIKQSQKKKHKIEFAGLNEHLQHVFQVIGFSDFISIHASVDKALN